MQTFFQLFPSLALFLYATLKAFLPLPSLEVLLLPLCILYPQKWLWFSIIGAIGTFLGGGIGYAIGRSITNRALRYFTSEENIKKGESLMNRYGILAVFIGGITPIPDFILAYLAGITHMPFAAFALSDALARFLRSVLITFLLNRLHLIIDLDRFGMRLMILLGLLFVMKWGIKQFKTYYLESKE
ncbi:MAG: VTT domain-containing protein [Erysipelotrichaceae bacterium]